MKPFTFKKALLPWIMLPVMFMFAGKGIDAKKVGSLPEIASPMEIIVSNGILYVSDQQQSRVFLYSMKDFKLVKEVSRKGEAPGETFGVPRISAYPGYIFLYCLGKGLYFSRDGKYTKEFRIRRRGNDLRPIGENFVFMINKGDGFKDCSIDFSIYSYSRENNLEFKKILYIEKRSCATKTGEKMDYNLINSSASYIVYDNKIFLGDPARGIYMEIFDKDGNRTGKIHIKQFEKQEVTDQFKKEYMERVKMSSNYTLATAMYNLYFPEYFPGYYKFTVDKGKVYFLTFNRKANQREMIISDWKGTL
jgi:hypothetical protein